MKRAKEFVRIEEIQTITESTVKNRNYTIKTFNNYCKGLKGIVGAVVIFDHGRKFGIFSIAPDHPAPQESFAIKKNTKLFLDIFF